MVYHLSFDRLIDYDSGLAGITLKVKLNFLGIEEAVRAKIDTGSTHCLFMETVGQALGIEIESGEPMSVSTATGSFQSYGHWMTLSVEDFEFESMIFFAADHDIGRNVLGRMGWLDRMIIGINDYDGKLYLRRYNE